MTTKQAHPASTPTLSGDAEHKLQQQQQTSAGFHSDLWDRLSHYSLVNYAHKTASSIYSAVKESNPLFNYTLQKVENNVANIATPLAYKFLDKTSTWGKPLLTEIDDFGCKQLDRLEDRFVKPFETLTYLPYVVLSKALDVTEGTLDYFLPPHSEVLARERALEEESKEELLKAGSQQDLEKTKSNFRYLGRRLTGQVSNVYQRLRERSRNHPYIIRFMDFTASRLDQFRQFVTAAFDFAAKTRNNVYHHGKNLVRDSTNLFLSLLQPFWHLFSIGLHNVQSGVHWSVDRFLGLINYFRYNTLTTSALSKAKEQKARFSRAVHKPKVQQKHKQEENLQEEEEDEDAEIHTYTPETEAL